MLDGAVEADETFIGGKARNMHKAERERKESPGPGANGKAIVFGMFEREGAPLSAEGDPRTPRQELHSRRACRRGWFGDIHQRMGRATRDSKMNTPTRSSTMPRIRGRPRPHERHRELLEPAQARLARHLFSVEPFHLFRYLDEHMFSYNDRERNRPGAVLRRPRYGQRQRRLTYAEVTAAD